MKKLSTLFFSYQELMKARDMYDQKSARDRMFLPHEASELIKNQLLNFISSEHSLPGSFFGAIDFLINEKKANEHVNNPPPHLR